MKRLQLSLNRLFNIRNDEWPLVLLLFLVPTLGNAGYIWGISIVYAAFLQQVGVAALPLMLVVSSLASVVASAIYTAFVDRIPDDKLLIYIFVVEIFCILLGLIFLNFGLSTLAFPFLYLLLLASVPVINPQQITYFNSFFNTQTAKRTLPVIVAGYRIGAIVSGLTMPLMTQWFSTSGIIIIWMITHLLMITVVWGIPHLIREAEMLQISATTEAAQQNSFIENMQEGFQYTIKSSYLRWLALSTLLMMIIMSLIEYRSSELLLQYYGTTEELSGFLGVLTGVGNLVTLPILLFGLSRLISRFGLGNASLVFPIANLGITGSLVFLPNLATAALAYLNRVALRLAIQAPIDGLLYNAVPLRVKGRARAFVNGLVVPIGSLVGGLMLLVPYLTTSWIVATLIAIISIAYAASGFIVRNMYSRALIRMLEEEDFSSLLSMEASDLTVSDPATLKSLGQKLENSDDPQFTIFMAKLLSQVGGDTAIPILAKAVRKAADPETRAGLLDVIGAADVSGQEVQQLYRDFVADLDPRVRLGAIMGLERLVGPDDPQFLNLALPMLSDPNIEIRTQLLLALARSENFYEHEQAQEALQQILTADNPQQRERGVLILSRVAYHRTARSTRNVTKSIYQLTTHLFDSADQVRLRAALGVEALSTNQLTERASELILQQSSHLIEDPVERIREVMLTIYSRLANQEAYPILVNAIADDSSRVRHTAINHLVQAGRSVISTVHPKLDAGNPKLRKMATVILARVDKTEFGPLITAQITSNLLLIYKNYGHLHVLPRFSMVTSVNILQDALQEQNEQLLEEIFYLLTALHNPASIRIITESLRSEDARVQANALEALEALTTPQTARLIGPLTGPTNSAELIELAHKTWEFAPPTPSQTISDLAQPDDSLIYQPDVNWLQAITIFVLGDIGSTITDQSNDNRPTKRGRSRRKGNIFDSLEELDDNATSKNRRGQSQSGNDLLGLLEGNEPEQKPPPRRRTNRKKQTDPFSVLSGGDKETDEQAKLFELLPFNSIKELREFIDSMFESPDYEVRMAARSAHRLMAGLQIVEARMAAHSINQLTTKTDDTVDEDNLMLSTIEKIIFLKKVPFFQGMTIDQLKTLGTVCEEKLFEEDTRIFNTGDAGGTLYVIISGKVAIEKEGKRRGSFARIATMGAHDYFGEMNLFDNSPHANSATAIKDTLTLRLRREPLVALARQYPELSLELIKVLSQRLREANDQIVGLTRTKPRELHKLFDQYD